MDAQMYQRIKDRIISELNLEEVEQKEAWDFAEFLFAERNTPSKDGTAVDWEIKRNYANKYRSIKAEESFKQKLALEKSL